MEKTSLMRHNYTIEAVKAAVISAECWSDVAKLLGLKPVGGNVSTVKRIVLNHNIDTSHFDSVKAMQRNKNRWTVETALVEHSQYPRSNLGKFVKKNKLLIYRCIKCSNDGFWNGTELRLELDHINGVSDDNRIENLRWLCPNCHSQTETFGNSKRT